MAYRPKGRAEVDPLNPRAFAICYRCGALYNKYKLTFQHQWMGNKLQNKHIQVCPTCLDKPSSFLRQIVLPPDPPSIYIPSVEPYAIDEAGSYTAPDYLRSISNSIMFSLDNLPILSLNLPGLGFDAALRVNVSASIASTASFSNFGPFVIGVGLG